MSVNTRHEVALLCSTCICLRCSASFDMCPCKMYAIIHCSTICHVLSVKTVFFNTTMKGKAKRFLRHLQQSNGAQHTLSRGQHLGN